MKTNAKRSGSFKNKIALRENAVSQKRWCLVKDDEIYVGTVQRLSEIDHEPEAIVEETRGRDSLDQNRDVDIAIRTDSAAGNRSEDVRRLNFASR
jgi:hypothetical protein